ncbi:MAG: class I SAM-dependent methyltransferase, partial [Candidatus Hydrogenedentes bacterium]|nr:class I SAM-dependent methyltransferase [Candidatus Hydrogenedentota bacterium]
VVTMAFGIRNVGDVAGALGEIGRVLKPGGRALILEFSLPRRWFVRGPYLLYLRHILPWVGGRLSGQPRAYRYLNQSVERFPHGQAFCDRLIEAGFADVRAYPLTCGIATLYQAEKPCANGCADCASGGAE